MEVAIGKGNLVRARFWHEEGRLRHAVEVLLDGQWQRVLTSGGLANEELCVNDLDFLELADEPAPDRVGFQAHLEEIAVGLIAQALRDDLLYFRCDVRMRLPADFARFCQAYEFFTAQLDDVWVPHLCPQAGDVISQHVFRAPNVTFQVGRLAVCIIPDLDLIESTWKKMPVAFDVDADCRARDRPLVAYGCINHTPRGHVYFAHDPEQARTFVFRDTLSFGWFVLIDHDCPRLEGWRRALRFCWERWAVPRLRDARTQTAAWERYAERAVAVLRRELWTETRIGGQTCGGPVMGRRAAGHRPWPNDIWFSCWFNSLRTALGLRLWALQTGDDDLMRRAEATKNLVLAAPRWGGAFATVYWFDYRNGRRHDNWATSHYEGGGEGLLSTADMSWTAHWLLRWYESGDHDPRLIDMAREYADWLLGVQLPCGAVPAWVRRDDGMPDERLKESIHTAASALFLAHLYLHVDDDRFLNAALMAEEYLRRELLPIRRFDDFEAYYSCSPKPLGFYDPRTRQYAQNTLSIHWTAEMYRALHLATGDDGLLREGLRWLDYLSLYQCHWQPPFMSTYVFGGFGVQNSDAEFLDARQAQFAETYADYYEIVRRPELLHRAIIAARAGFVCMYAPENEAVCPKGFDAGPAGHSMENWGHDGADSPGGESGFDWGSGSALAAAAFLRYRYGDALVEADASCGFGVNACLVHKVQREAERIEVALESTVDGPRQLRLVVRGLRSEEEAVLVVNRRELGRFRGGELAGGVHVET